MLQKRLIVAGIIAAAALLLGRRVHLDGDLERLLPDSDAELNRAGAVLQRVMQRTVVEVEPDKAEAVAGRLRPYVKSVWSGPAEGDIVTLVETLRARAPRLIDNLQMVAWRTGPAQVRQTLQTLARRLQEPDGAYLAARAARDPLGITDLALGGLQAFNAGLSGARIQDGRLVSADGSRTLLFVEPGFAATDTAKTKKMIDALEGVRFLGTHRATYDNAEQMQRDVRLTLLLGVLCVVGIALFVFRRLGVALLAMLPAAYGAVVALGVYALFRDSIAAAVAGFSAVLLGITIDYAVHVFYAEKPPARAILIGATTTAAAFLALRISAVPGLREIGTFGALGVCGAALFAILVLPGPRRRRPLDLSPVVRKLQSRGALILLVCLLPLAIWGATRVRVDGNVKRLSRISPEANEDEAAILRRWGRAFRVTTLVVQGEDLEQALQRNEQLKQTIARYRNASLAGLLPSRRTQDERLKAWKEFWSPDRVAQLRASVREGVRGTPFREDAFDGFFDALTEDPPYMEPRDLPEEFRRDRLLDDHRIATPVFEPNYLALETLVRKSPFDVLVVNREAFVVRMAEMIRGETAKLGLVALAAVIFVVSLWLGRIGQALVVLVPLLASCLFTFGVLGWLDVRITLANAIFVAFLFGLAVDYSIFLMHGRLELRRTGKDNTAETDSAVLLCAFTTIAGFGVLALAGHPILHSIGVTALAGIASAVFVTQALMPRLVGPRTPPTHPTIETLFRDQGPILSRYAPSKAKRDPIVKAAPELAGDANDILVAGCGHGIVMAELALHQKPVRGIDLDEKKVETARGALRHLPGGISIERGDLFAADLKSPDCIFAVDLLHYWTEGKQEDLLRRLVDALPMGGRLVFRDGCAGERGHKWVERFERLAVRTGFTRAGDGFCFRTREGWLRLMADCGLEVEEERSDLGLGSNLALLCRKSKS